ncbi:MAG: Rrf2 family transcriptional regulator [Muribaculaceae bacterium]
MFSEKVHCILIVVITLTKKHGNAVSTASEIASEHNIPLAYVSDALDTLKQEHLVLTSGTGQLVLSDKVKDMTLYDIISRFGSKEFNGIFIDEATGLPLKQSMASRVIINEQNELHGIIQTGLQYMKLLEWSEKAGKTICI